ncbi:hypothetical protein HanIR_Chr15g0739651 [Helianthus annuus]|nr:hypothetical protein HanIR_Chr15g0739651 [Helianthus annuus]
MCVLQEAHHFMACCFSLSLDGPVVTALGSGDELGVVTHSSPSLPSNEQMLTFDILNFPQKCMAAVS